MTYPCLLPVVQVEHLRHDLAGGRQDVLELPRLVLLLLLAGLFLLLLFLLLDHQRLQDVPGPVKGADTAAEEDLRPEFFLMYIYNSKKCVGTRVCMRFLYLR